MTTLAVPAVRPRARREPLWWRDAVGMACWTTALAVVGLWLHGGGAQDLSAGTGPALTSLGRLAGLVAADLLLVQVFLMARVPLIEQSYGQDELVRRHRLVGFWSFNLMLVHIVLITAGYAVPAKSGVIVELFTVITTLPGMLMATMATVALVAVTVTSIRAARRRMRYESWHLIHLYAYVGVGLSIPHELWAGSDLNASPMASTFWWSAYAVAAGSVVVYRLGLPAFRSMRHGIRVTSVVRESPDVVTVRMAGRDLHELPVRAGQYFVWRFLDGPGWSRGNPYSLSAAPRHDRVQITVKEQGDGSGRLASLRPGTRVLVEGPYGRMTPERKERTRVAFLACGIGITPMRALLEDLAFAPGTATLVHRARTEPDLVFRTELEQLAAARGVTVHHLVGPRVQDRASWLPESAAEWDDARALKSLVPDLADTDVYVCGPDAWMDAVAQAAERAGLPTEQLHMERFAW